MADSWFARSRKVAKGAASLWTNARSAAHFANTMTACGADDEGRTVFAALRLCVNPFLLFMLALSATPAFADSLMPDAHYANVQLEDPAKEKAAKALMESVRCLVCQGQSIADSDADMAGDMRALIRRRIDEGQSPTEVRSWLVERYGNWVTYDPPLGATTYALWAAPILFLIMGFFLARGRFRRRRS